jgi:hypothetical protein
MVHAIKRTVRIQSGGRLELVSKELPEGAEAEVIVLLSADWESSVDCWGTFAEESEVIDEIVADAMSAREEPFRRSRG